MKNALVFVLLVVVAVGSGRDMGFAHSSLDAPAAAAALTCPNPNVPAKVMVAAQPQTPLLARTDHITGSVEVLITLDELSHVTDARIRSSPSAVLNAPALDAARGSVFQTEVRNCVSVARDFVFIVEFTDQAPGSSTAVYSLRPEITAYFSGIWWCSSSESSQIVKAYGILSDGITLYLANSFITPAGRLFTGAERYTQAGKTVTAVIRNGTFASTTKSSGFDGDTLTFEGTQQTTELLRQREIIVKKGHDAFRRTFETAAMGDDSSPVWRQTSNEECRRIVNGKASAGN